MVKLNVKLLLQDKEALNKQWDEMMRQDVIDRDKAVYLMDRLNAIDKFLIHQGIFK